MRQEKTRDLGFLGRLASTDGDTGETGSLGSTIHGGIRARGAAPSREAEEGEGYDEAGGVRWRLLPWETIWRPTPDALQSRQARLKIYLSRHEKYSPKNWHLFVLPTGFCAHARQKSMRRFAHTCAVCTQRERKARSRSAAASAAAAAAASSRCHSA
jgi:hypothetical protein